MRITGIVLIVVGLISLALGGISYTTKEKVVDLGPIQATAERHKTIPLPPLLGDWHSLVGSRCSWPDRKSASPVDDLAADHGEQRLDILDLVNGAVQEVL